MKRSLSYAVLLILLSSALFSDSKKYSITTHGKDNDTRLEFSREFFVNNIYLDFMVPFGLDRIFTDSDYIQIFNELYNDLSENYQTRIVIPVNGDRSLSILFKSLPLENGISLLVISNYDMTAKKLLPGDGDLSGCYSRQYIIAGKSLVPGHIFYLKDREKEIKKFVETSDYNGLADFYLFDHDKSNDREIPAIIASGLKKTPAGYNSCLLRLTESQYHIFHGKFSSAEISLNIAEKSAASISDPEQKRFIYTSVKLMRRILYISRNVQQI